MNINRLQKALDAEKLKNDAITSNIANIDTPEYKRKKVKFEELLKQASDIDKVNPEIKEVRDMSTSRLDGNNVDIDQEMSELAKNQIRYNALISQVSSQFDRMRTVLRG